MQFRRIAMTFVMTAVAAAPGAFGQTTTTTTRDVTIGPIGVGSTETIQINVVNLASNSSTGTAASCTGSITFNNTTGNPIGTSTPFTVISGQIFSATLPFAKISTSTARTEVTGVVAMTTSSTSRTPCDLRFSLETFDTTTGATHVYVSGAAEGGPVGGAGGPGGGPGPGR
jgi:hypothetical protein